MTRTFTPTTEQLGEKRLKNRIHQQQELEKQQLKMQKEANNLVTIKFPAFLALFPYKIKTADYAWIILKHRLPMTVWQQVVDLLKSEQLKLSQLQKDDSP